MKPTTESCSLINNIIAIHQKSYIQARLNAWGKDELICECGSISISPTSHIFFECNNEIIQFQRSTLWIMIDLFAPEVIKTSTKTTQML